MWLPRQMLKLFQMRRCKEGRWSAQIGVECADVAECRLGVRVAEVLLDRNQRHPGLVQPPGIGPAQIMGLGSHDLATDGEGIASSTFCTARTVSAVRRTECAPL